MKDLILLVKTEILREFISLKRYPIETISGLCITGLFFMVLLFSAKMMAGKLPLGFEDTTKGIMIGYLIWLLTTSSIQIMSNEVSEEEITGTMEQVYISPAGPICLLLSRSIVGLLSSVMALPIIFYLLQILTGVYLDFNFLSILPILVLTFIGLCGFGFILAGITLIFKRIDIFLSLIPIALLGLAMLPVEALPSKFQVLALGFPLTQGVKLARCILLEGQSFIILLNEIFYLGLISIFYLSIGIFGYNLSDKIARDKGLLGYY